MTAPDLPTWPCEAYGDDPAVLAAGAWCFLGDAHHRVCERADVCARNVQSERERVHLRLREQAAAGDPVGTYLLSEFPTPEHMLGGPAAPAEPVVEP